MPASSPRALALAAALLLPAAVALAQTDAPLAPREVPAKTIPVPHTVSPELQQIIAQPLRTAWNTPPKTPEGWKQLAQTCAPMRAECRVDARAPEGEGGTRDDGRGEGLHGDAEKIRRTNRNRVLIHMHGGCYVLNPGRGRHCPRRC